MYFSASGIETAFFVPSLAAFCISALTSTSGVSGAFLLLPFQISVLGCTSPSVSATNQFYNIIATPGGVWRFYREGRLLAPLALLTVLGSLPGVAFGAIIRLRWLADINRFKLFAAFVLLYLAWRLTKDLLTDKSNESAPGAAKVTVLESNLRRGSFIFQGNTYSYNVPQVLCLTMAIGIIGGIYGIGGGAILAPFLISIFKLPVYVVAGSTLLCTLATSIGGMASYMLLAPYYPALEVSPDFKLGLALGLGGLLGMYCGARLQKYLPPRQIKIILCLIIVGTALAWLVPQLWA